jgi:hypothetical protein
LYLQTLSKRAYLVVENADALYAEYAAQGVEFTRGLGNMPWHKREFVVKDCDGRLLAFGANLLSSPKVLFGPGGTHPDPVGSPALRSFLSFCLRLSQGPLRRGDVASFQQVEQ